MMPHLATTGRLQGKSALVTGAASGIGRATTLLFAREGAAVAVTDVDEAKGTAVVEEIRGLGGRAHWFRLDVTQEADWDAAIRGFLAAEKRLDVFVANAGISFAKPVAEMTSAEWRRVLAVNLDGVFLGAKHAIRAMKPAGGSIVIVSSATGVKAVAGAGAYGAGKAAVRHLARTLALECGPQIRVNTVLPGGVETPMWRSMEFWTSLVREHGSEAAAWRALGKGAPLGRFAKPEEIAGAILFLASDASGFVTGAEIAVDGGYTA